MLENFFDIRKNSEEMFQGLEIAKNKELCSAWMNKYPVIFLSLKNVEGLDFPSAYQQLVYEISSLYREHEYLLDSPVLSTQDKFYFQQIRNRKAEKTDILRSIQFLSRLLVRHYDEKVILLMDEYDVPVAKANSNGYYREMLDVMKGLLQALKDNQAIRFAVITGCLKIAKESIFTGTNNFVSDTITDSRLNEYFGFVQDEVDRILEDAGAEEHSESVKNGLLILQKSGIAADYLRQSGLEMRRLLPRRWQNFLEKRSVTMITKKTFTMHSSQKSLQEPVIRWTPIRSTEKAEVMS